MLDMRMDVRSRTAASQVLNEYSRADLARIFREYGELRNAGALAAALVKAREMKPLDTTGDLERALREFIPKSHPSKFLARVYQALRIEVNHEVESLREMLLQTEAAMHPGGRLVVITYHSIEDRLVKNYMRSGNLKGTVNKDFYGNIESPWKVITKSVITPAPEEIEKNNRARSAKLRIAERLN
jgi:16S rRNA (cytosine1402-N4)-methyltransferase